MQRTLQQGFLMLDFLFSFFSSFGIKGDLLFDQMGLVFRRTFICSKTPRDPFPPMENTVIFVRNSMAMRALQVRGFAQPARSVQFWYKFNPGKTKSRIPPQRPLNAVEIVGRNESWCVGCGSERTSCRKGGFGVFWLVHLGLQKGPFER